jgi:hypothetical protein
MTEASDPLPDPALSTPGCDIAFDPEVPCVLIRWRGYVTSEEFRQASDNALRLLQEQHVSRILNDTTDLPIISAADQRWVQSDFVPRGIAVGFRAVAMVNSRFYFNRVAVDSVVAQLDPEEIMVEYFENPEKARAWLRRIF